MNVSPMVNILRTLIWLVTLPLLFGCERSRVDALMEELCQKDGGIKIYERIILQTEQLTENGYPKLFETWNRSSGGYHFRSDHERLNTGKPSLTRYVYTITREEDKKLLGEYVTYLRKGGGLMWRPGPDPFKRCPAEDNDGEFLKKVFVSEN